MVKRYLVAGLLAVAACLSFNQAQTYVQGPITGRVVWDTLNSPYKVTGDIIIGSGDTLVIDPGVEVRFQANVDSQSQGKYFSDCEIYLDGRGILIAEGTDTDSILFTSDAGGSSAIGDWGGISPTDTSSVFIENCIFEYCTRGVYIANEMPETVIVRKSHFSNVTSAVKTLIGSVGHFVIDSNRIIQPGGYGIDAGTTDGMIITNNYFYKPPTIGIYGYGCADITITGNVIDSTGDDAISLNNPGDSISTVSYNTLRGENSTNQAGIYVNGGTPNMRHNTIDNFERGIYLVNSIEPANPLHTISGNTITNGTHGIMISGNYARPSINYNNIYGMAEDGLYSQGGGMIKSTSAFDINAKYNYWGETVTATMEASSNPVDITGIYDNYESPYYGVVNYGAWLDTVDGTPTTNTVTGILELTNAAEAVPKSFMAGDTVYVKLQDADENQDGGVVETVTVSMTSATETVPEFIQLLETGADAGIFKGSIVLDSNGTQAADGVLQVVFEDEITAAYADVANDYGDGETVETDAGFGVTVVSGEISGSETWTLANSPYVVTGDVIVGTGDMLTIEAGVRVLFTGEDDQQAGNNLRLPEISVSDGGYLYAAGTEGDSIVFESVVDNPGYSEWQGINFEGTGSGLLEYCQIRSAQEPFFSDNASADSVVLRHSKIEHCQMSVNIDDAAATGLIVIDNNWIRDVNYYMIDMYRAENYVISNNLLDTTSSGYAIYVYGQAKDSNAVIQGNLIRDDGGSGSYAIRLYNSAADIINNQTQHVWCGAYIDVTAGYAGLAEGQTIKFNSFENTTYGIWLKNIAEPIVRFNDLDGAVIYSIYNQSNRTIDARYNWWGQEVTDSMEAGGNPKNLPAIYDTSDNLLYGTVDYSEWRSETVSGDPAIYSIDAVDATEEVEFVYHVLADDADGAPTVDFGPLPGWLTQYGDTVRGTPDDPISDTVFMAYATSSRGADSLLVTVTVTAINDAPWVADSGYVVQENSAIGTVIGLLGFDDPEHDLLTFTILAGNDDNLFGLSAETLLVDDNLKLDHEYDSSYTLIVEVSDGSLADTASITVGVADVNEVPWVADSGFVVPENEPVGTVIGLVNFDDPERDMLTFTILSGNTDALFGMVAETLFVVDNSVLDHEHDTSYTLLIEVSDGSLADTATVAVGVSDVVDNLQDVSSTGAYDFTGTGVSMVVSALTGSDDITVSVYPDSFPPNLPGANPLARFFRISSGVGITGITAVVTFTYTQAEFDASDITGELSLYAARWNGTAWEQFASVVDTLNNTVTCTTSQFSIWALGGEGGPVPVELTSFIATFYSGGVELVWTTVSEQDNLGFNVLRSNVADGKYVQVNDGMIATTGVAGGTYGFTDDAAAGIWYYVLEQVGLDGTAALSDPVGVTVEPTHLDDLVRTLINPERIEGELLNLSGLPVMTDEVQPGVYLMKTGNDYLKVIITR